MRKERIGRDPEKSEWCSRRWAEWAGCSGSGATADHQMELHKRFLRGSCTFQSHSCRKSASAVPDAAAVISEYCALEGKFGLGG